MFLFKLFKKPKFKRISYDNDNNMADIKVNIHNVPLSNTYFYDRSVVFSRILNIYSFKEYDGYYILYKNENNFIYIDKYGRYLYHGGFQYIIDMLLNSKIITRVITPITDENYFQFTKLKIVNDVSFHNIMYDYHNNKHDWVDKKHYFQYKEEYTKKEVRIFKHNRVVVVSGFKDITLQLIDEGIISIPD